LGSGEAKKIKERGKNKITPGWGKTERRKRIPSGDGRKTNVG